ncbi:DUF4135 domain-containing protein [Candidatus Protochlamydia sp. R18]|uniref:DUF4135 domain-containing protein n=1 Tax=Candidatus Protochlamydia sp. R18 TaxID=1353977 RepID=UPI0005A91169|nr:DUF4135 domain-containing protein [Candidatus Protochlamydia sp. R18]
MENINTFVGLPPTNLRSANIQLSSNTKIEEIQPATQEPVSLEYKEQINLITDIFRKKNLLNRKEFFLDEKKYNLKEELETCNNQIQNLENSIQSGKKEEQESFILNKQLNDALNVKNKLITKIRKTRQKYIALEKEMDACSKAIQEEEERLCQIINNKFSSNIIDVETLPVKFSEISLSSYSSEEEEKQVDYLINKQITSLERFERFIFEATNFLEAHKILIFKEFGKKNVENISNVKINLKLLGADSHHGGKTPLLVSLTIEEAEVLKVVYKPRGAETDKAIIELFEKLNSLPPEQKNGPDLPTYKIIDLQNHSLWQYIEGVDYRNTAFEFVKILET